VEKIAVVLVAGGRGSRAGQGLPKQYRKIAGIPLIRRTFTALREALPNVPIQPVIHPDDIALLEDALKGLAYLRPVFGGATRQASVLAGLEALASEPPKYVLVHDAARPFVQPHVIDGVIDGLDAGHAAVIPGLPIVDTLNRVVEERVQERVDRSALYGMQTPQGFSYSSLLTAHRTHAGDDLTDDGAVMEKAGHSLMVSSGDEANFKVTLESDFLKAERQLLMQLNDIRSGTGFDVHRFEPGSNITLCGYTFPSDRALRGHSDADVGLHALTDALLAAIAEGDIGTHFPPSEEKWKGAASDVFLKHAASLLRDKGGVISNVTVCLICEKPKISPHKDMMRQAIADILNIDVSRVSVQATTTEKLGFTGREEGIAAQASATVRLP